MKEETRYRVTGSLFLLALAVICLPMLLDGAGLPARELADLPMDDSPPDVQPLAAQPPESNYVARVQQLRDEVDQDGFLTGSGTHFGEPVLTPGDAAGSVRSDSGASRPQSGDRKPAAADRPGTGGAATEAWAVQVASFARAANAEEFRTRLRKDGYEAFISTARLDGQVLSRVAVGPLLDRKRAETLRGELTARYDVQARLMAFSN